MRVLLVEDDELLGLAVKTGLTQAGYTVDWVSDSEAAIEALDAVPFGAVVLDLDLPVQSGLQVLVWLRQTSSLPVVIISVRDGLDDRIEALDLGADDYLVKPFDLRELLARLRAVIRRSQGRAKPFIVHQDIEVDTQSRTVSKAGQWVKLTSREFQILRLLLERTGRIMSKSAIEALVYSRDGDIESNTIEANIYTLRKKLGRELITTVRSVGYIILNGSL